MPTRYTHAAAVIAVVFTAVVLGATPASAVADGTPALPGQYPFAVKLAMTHIPQPGGTFYDSACSAALISGRVPTAQRSGRAGAQVRGLIAELPVSLDSCV